MKHEPVFLEMLREAVETLVSTGRPLEEVLDAPVPDEQPPTIAHALGVFEGAGVTLGLTALELIDAFDLHRYARRKTRPVAARRER